MSSTPGIITLALGALAIVLLSPILLVPLNADNDTYQSMAFAMEQGRGLPYLGSWDQNFPGVVFYHWIGIKLFGLSDLAFRIVDVLNQVAIAFLLYRLASRYVSIDIALLAIPLTCLLYLNSGMWNAGQRDGFALTWLVIALLQITKAEVGKRELAIYGLALAAATFIRPTNIFFFATAIPLIRAGRVPRPVLLMAVIAFAVSTIVFICPWLAHADGLHEFYRATVTFNLEIYGGGKAPLRDLYESVHINRYFHFAALAGLAVVISRRWLSKLAPLLVHGLVAITLILLMGKYFLYHFEPLVPLTIVLAVVAVDRLLSGSKTMRYVGIAVLALGFIIHYPHRLPAEFVKRGADAEALQQIHQNLASVEGYSYQLEHAVIHYLDVNRVTFETEFLLLYPGLRWRSGHPGLSRFTTTYLMTMGGTEHLTPYQREWRAEADSVIFTRRPRAIVAARGPEYLFKLSNISPDSLLHLLPRTSVLLGDAYRLDTTIGGFNIYRRNEAAH